MVALKLVKDYHSPVSDNMLVGFSLQSLLYLLEAVNIPTENDEVAILIVEGLDA